MGYMEKNAQDCIGDFEMCNKKDLPIIIGRNDGCDTCDELGYICEDCIEEWLGDEEYND